MKKLMISLILSMQLLLPSTAVRATGIPTVDVLHIAETIVSYVQQLVAYGEMLTQSALQGKQYTQMLADYNQMMTEYALLLNRVEGLHASLSGAEWLALVNEINKYYGSGDIGLAVQLDPLSATYATDVRTLLARMGLAPRTRAQVVADYTTAGVTDTTVVTKNMDDINAVYSKYSNQHEVVANNRKQIAQFGTMKATNISQLQNLGNETDLKTLQFIAAQQIFQQEQAQLQATISNQQLQAYEPASILNAQALAAEIEREKARIALVKARTYHNGATAINNWADLGL